MAPALPAAGGGAQAGRLLLDGVDWGRQGRCNDDGHDDKGPLTPNHLTLPQHTHTTRQPPLVFCHGISPGLWFYTAFLERMGQGREVVLLEVPHIVTQLAFEAPDIQVCVCVCVCVDGDQSNPTQSFSEPAF